MLEAELTWLDWIISTALIAGGLGMAYVLGRWMHGGERIHRPGVLWQTWIVQCDTFGCCRRRLQPLPPPSISPR